MQSGQVVYVEFFMQRSEIVKCCDECWGAKFLLGSVKDLGVIMDRIVYHLRDQLFTQPNIFSMVKLILNFAA